jgi:pyruvate,water dikinase
MEKSEYNRQIKELLSKEFTAKDVLQLSSNIKDLILNSVIPDGVLREVKFAFKHIHESFNGEISFAVRSSASIEDSSNFSFAGQADTFLYNKSLEEIIDSIKKCWASLFSPGAILYLLQMRKQGVELSLLDIEMAVVVQKMVNSHISGTLFTVNVLDNDTTKIYIISTWGLGETLANNIIVPDTIIVDKANFEIIKLDIGKKEKKSIQNPEGSGTILVDNDSDSQNICSLNEDQIREICKVGLKIESALEFPQDIELAIEKGIIYVLQARPITTLKI